MPQAATIPRFASAVSDAADTAKAVEHVVDQLCVSFEGTVDLAVVFVTGHHAGSMELIQQRINEEFSPFNLIGATTQGVVGVRRELEEGPGISVLLASLPGAELTPFTYDQIDWQAVQADPQSLATSIGDPGSSPKALLMLADPFSTPMVKMLPAIGQCWPELPVVGGMLSGGRQPGSNRLLLNGEIFSEGAIGLAIGGPIRVDTTVSQGCRPIGTPYVITRSKRHIVMELGGRNAMEVVKDTVRNLDENDRDLLKGHTIMIGRVINEYKDRFGRGDFLIRSVVGVDKPTGYIAINDPQIRMGQTLQFHLRDQQTACEDFSLLLEAQKLHATEDEAETASGGALLFSCNGRGSHMFDQPNADANMVHDALGNIPLTGFFAAGEIGPVGGQNFVHGHTASLMVIRAE